MEIAADPLQLVNMLQKRNKNTTDLKALLTAEPNRFKLFSRQLPGLLYDFSRCSMTEADFSTWLQLSNAVGIPAARDALFAGVRINLTENRPVLHSLWRERNFAQRLPQREADECVESLERMRTIASALHAGELPESPGARIRHLVHVGIGGSLLGPRMLCGAFPANAPVPEVHFISSVDAWSRERLLESIDPAETAIVLVSKSFTTTEVMAHARRLRQWQLDGLDADAAAKRLYAATAAPAKALAFGVLPQNTLQMGEWTGGRFSLWSPVSLSAAAHMGFEAFEQLCAGGASMDRHFREEPPLQNLPIIHGLLSCWHRNACSFPCRGIVPYDGRLAGLPGWLQQVQMESNGKSVTRNGDPVKLPTTPIVFGDCGTDAQHALFQAFHQGTEVVPLDFIGVIRPDHRDTAAQTELLAHLLAQASALAIGRDAQETTSQMTAEGKSGQHVSDLLPHRVMPGNRPSSIFLLDALTPYNLGQLLVLYEQSVFVESVVWDINAFDQWGVELGKVMAGTIEPALAGQPNSKHGIPGLDPLLDYVRQRLTNT